MRKQFLAIMAIIGLAAPAVAQSNNQTESGVMTTVTVDPSAPEGLVVKVLQGPDSIQMASLQDVRGASCNVTACIVTYGRNPSFFQGTKLCVSNTGHNWAIRPDSTLDLGNPTRQAFCAPLVNGRATVRGIMRTNATPFLERDGRAIAWVDRKVLLGNPKFPDFVSFE